MRGAEIPKLFDFGINCIHSNSDVTVMTSLYNTWICSNRQRVQTKEEYKSTESVDEEDTITLDMDTEDEDTSILNDWRLLSILKGFNVIQVFCCQNMINLLTDTGDVYCSLFADLQAHQTEMLHNRNITKITGCTATDKCVALSADGKIFEWSVITESIERATNEEDPATEDKDTEKEVDPQNEEKVTSPPIMKISEVQQLTQIDLKIQDIAVSSTAYAAITEDGDMILWGDYSKIYSINMEKVEEKGKKKKKKSKDKDNVEETNVPNEPYIIVKPKTENETENEEDVMPEVKYQSIMGCTDSFVALDCDGNVHTFGTSDCGALGLGDDVAECLQPQRVSFGKQDSLKTVSITCSGSSCVAVDADGVVWYWGKTFPPISDDTSEQETKPTEDTNEDQADAEQKQEEQLVYAVPVQVTMDVDIQQIRAAVVTEVGGFVWS